MSSISSTGSSSSANAAAYQEQLARIQAQKQAAITAQQVAKPAPAATGDVDQDGDSK